METVLESLDAHYQRYQEVLQNLTLMSDPLMRNVLKIKECTQYVLQIILDRKDLEVITVTVQKDLKNLHGRSVVLDVLAKDQNGSLFCVEIQQNDDGASPMRARFISGLLDMNILDSGKDFKELPASFTIFITKNDVLKGNLPIYHIERRIAENGQLFGDHAHIIYVNSSIQDDTELGRLMHDFHCKQPDDMYSAVLAKHIRALKEPSKEGKVMCEELEKLYQEGIEEGIEKGIFSSIKNLMISLGLSLEEAMNALRIPENERRTYVKLLAGQ